MSCVKIYNNGDLYGEWEGENPNYKIKLNFGYGGACLLEIKDLVSKETGLYSGLFKINYSKKPIPLSITNVDQINTPLHTIVEFVGKDKIKIQKFSTRWKLRPVAFNNESDIILYRKA